MILSTYVRKVGLLIMGYSMLLSCSNTGGDHKSSTMGDSVSGIDTTGGDSAKPGGFVTPDRGNERKIDMEQFSETVSGITYSNTSNPGQMFDIIYPDSAKPPYKVIILLHDGLWMAGDKQSESISSFFGVTSQGYVLVSVNYRLSNEVTWPRPLHDVKTAIRFLRTNGEKYDLDTRNIVVWGASAGGHIAQMLGATNGQPNFEDLALGSPNESSAVQGVVSWYGVSDISKLTASGIPAANKIMGFDVAQDTAMARLANPIDLVRPSFPPLLLVHGTADGVVPYSQAVEMQKKVNELTGKQTAELITFEGAAHGDKKIKTTESIARSLDFVDKILYKGKNPYRKKANKNIRLVP